MRFKQYLVCPICTHLYKSARVYRVPAKFKYIYRKVVPIADGLIHLHSVDCSPEPFSCKCYSYLYFRLLSVPLEHINWKGDERHLSIMNRN